MTKVKNIIEAIIIFMGGVLTAYWTYPFMNSFLSAIDATSGVWEGWANIRFIMWAGYLMMVLLLIIGWPAYKIFIQDVEVPR